jgi:hypothetical protein
MGRQALGRHGVREVVGYGAHYRQGRMIAIPGHSCLPRSAAVIVENEMDLEVGRGFMYNPTTSRTLSINRGSGESLNVSVRCGFNPNVCQMRPIVT